jgi:hypothetical protein
MLQLHCCSLQRTAPITYNHRNHHATGEAQLQLRTPPLPFHPSRPSSVLSSLYTSANRMANHAYQLMLRLSHTLNCAQRRTLAELDKICDRQRLSGRRIPRRILPGGYKSYPSVHAKLCTCVMISATFVFQQSCNAGERAASANRQLKGIKILTGGDTSDFRMLKKRITCQPESSLLCMSPSQKTKNLYQ